MKAREKCIEPSKGTIMLSKEILKVGMALLSTAVGRLDMGMPLQF